MGLIGMTNLDRLFSIPDRHHTLTILPHPVSGRNVIVQLSKPPVGRFDIDTAFTGTVSS